MRAEGPSFLGVFGLVGVLLGLRVVLLGTWWWRVVLVVAAVYVVAALVRRVRPLAAPFAAVAALALMVVWIFLPTTTVVGVPTGATWTALGDQLSLAIAVVAEEQAPLAPPEALVMFIALGFGLVILQPAAWSAFAAFALAGFGCATLIPAAYAEANRVPGFRDGTGITVVGWVMRIGFLFTSPAIGLIADAGSLRLAFVIPLVSGCVVVAIAVGLQVRARWVSRGG